MELEDLQKIADRVRQNDFKPLSTIVVTLDEGEPVVSPNSRNWGYYSVEDRKIHVFKESLSDGEEEQEKNIKHELCHAWVHQKLNQKTYFGHEAPWSTKAREVKLSEGHILKQQIGDIKGVVEKIVERQKENKSDFTDWQELDDYLVEIFRGIDELR